MELFLGFLEACFNFSLITVCISYCKRKKTMVFWKKYLLHGTTRLLGGWFFVNFCMVLESHVTLCVTELDSLGKFFLPLKLGKETQNGPKTGFFQFIGKYGNWYLMNLIYNENVYYLLCSCTNPIFGKNFVPEIWAKMFSVNQIAGFFNQPYLQNKSLK